jgi:hypothetical protein
MVKTPAKVSAPALPTARNSKTTIPLQGPPSPWVGLFHTTMPANRFNGFTDYGIGVGLRVPHYNHIF